MASEKQHLEVVIELRPGADPGVPATWLRRHGLDAMPLVVGLLATGDAAAVRSAFGTDPEGTLPVPEELHEHVASVAVVPAITSALPRGARSLSTPSAAASAMRARRPACPARASRPPCSASAA